MFYASFYGYIINSDWHLLIRLIHLVGKVPGDGCKHRVGLEKNDDEEILDDGGIDPVRGGRECLIPPLD